MKTSETKPLRAVPLQRLVRIRARLRLWTYGPAIRRLNAMAEEIRPAIETESDPKKKDRLIREYLTCTTAASFLLNDE
jgi:hypothetical protein